ncbi:isochorismatase family protein [Streptacidiphilus neutrinimicus]|uniref:isochorismatase family protein n=1 Tax=Streptacidiphilus neutrinimicus TaxID=105420 RepID=UPI0006938744|nr:isochorismatase family protein [Streptacidiphilus neutrinimicus]
MPTVLVLINVQRDMLLSPSVTTALRELLNRARNEGAPVVHLRTGREELIFGSWPGEQIVEHTADDAFLGSALTDALPLGCRIALAGVWSEEAVRTTGLGAIKRGYRVVLISGAHEGYAPDAAPRIEHELATAGAVIAGADAVAFS